MSENKPHAVNLRLPSDLHARAVEEAGAQGVSLSQYLRYCIASKVAEHRVTRTHAARAVDAARDARSELASVLARVPDRKPDPWDEIARVAEAPAEYVDSIDRFMGTGGRYPKPS